MFIQTIEDFRSYAKLGGAVDKLSESYPFAAQAIDLLDTANDNLGSSRRVAQIVKAGGVVHKAYDYTKKVHDLIDHNSRQGAIVKLGVRASLDIAARVIGTSLTSHPYYAYHKAMIDTLADALNVNAKSKHAIQAYERALGAADSKRLAQGFRQMDDRKIQLTTGYRQFIEDVRVAKDIARGVMGDSVAKRKISEIGSDRLKLAVNQLEVWRAGWSGLCFQSMQVQVMAGVELVAVATAMRELARLSTELSQGNNLHRVGGYSVTAEIEYQKYQQVVRQGHPDRLVQNPVRFAQANYDKAKHWAEAFSKMCDWARSDQVYYPTAFAANVDGLGRTMYGDR